MFADKMGLTGKELIEWIIANHAEEKIIYYQPEPGRAFKEVASIGFDVKGWFEEIVVIKGP